MAEVGLAPPPPGVTPNFHPPHTDVQIMLITTTIAFLSLSTATLAARLYTSFGIIKKCEPDDVFIFLAWATSVGFSVIQMNALRYGWGKHLWDTTSVQLEEYMQHVSPMAVMYMLSPTLAKLAILTLYHRIHPERTIRIFILAVGVAIMVYTVVLIVIMTVPCDALKIGNSACLQNSAVAHGILNVIFDVVLIVLPIPVIHNLNMPMRQKMIVGMIFGIGSGAIVCSIGRVVVVEKLAGLPDFTYYQPKTGVWSTAELNLCIMCNCLTRLRPFLKKHFPRIAISWSSQGKSGGQKQPNVPSWHLTTIGAKRTRESAKGIHITHEYHVDTERSAQDFDEASTDNIVAAGRDVRAGRTV